MAEMKAMPSGISPEAPMPCTARPAISHPRFVERIVITVPIMKIMIPSRIRRRLPTTSLNRPYRGMRIMNGKVNTAATHAVISAGIWKSSRMIGKATRTIEPATGMIMAGTIRLYRMRRASSGETRVVSA